MKPTLRAFFSRLLGVGWVLSLAVGFFNPQWRGRLLGILLPKFRIKEFPHIYKTKTLFALAVSNVIMLIDKAEDWDLMYPALEELGEAKTRAVYAQSVVSAYLINAHIDEAYTAANYWCALTSQEIEDDVDQARSFFQSWIDQKTYVQGFNELCRVMMEQWRLLPADEKVSSPSPQDMLLEERKRTSKYLRYYESHMALELLKQVESRNTQEVDWRQVKHLGVYDPLMKLPNLKFEEELFFAMGLDEAAFKQIERSVRYSL